MVKYLLEHGADIHAHKDEALKWAAYCGHLDVVEYLIEQGSNIHLRNNGAIDWAAQGGYAYVIDYLKKVVSEKNIDHYIM